MCLSYKEIEDLIFSKAIVMEGILIDTIKTVDMDAKQKQWYLLKPLFKN